MKKIISKFISAGKKLIGWSVIVGAGLVFGLPLIALVLGLFLLASLGLFSFIWLITLGEWRAIIWGICLTALGPMLISILWLPRIGIIYLMALLMGKVQNKLHASALIFMGISQQILLCAGMTIWGISILYFFTGSSNAESVIPLLIWSFTVAVGTIGRLHYNETKIRLLKGVKDIQDSRDIHAFALAYVLSGLAILSDKMNIFSHSLTPVNIAIMMFIVIEVGLIIAGAKDFYKLRKK